MNFIRRKKTKEEKKAVKEMRELYTRSILIGSDRKLAFIIPLKPMDELRKEVDSYNERLEEIISQLTILNEQHKLISDEDFEQMIFGIRVYGLRK